MKNEKIRLQMICGVLIVGSVIGQLAARGIRDYKGNHAMGDAVIHTEVTSVEAGVKTFNPGEHVISIPYKEMTYKSIFDNSETSELPYHPGYTVIGMSEKTILYSNVEPVTCTSINLDRDNEYVYDSFGVPEGYETIEHTDTTTKEFGVGEHVILRPITDPSKNTQQYLTVEGYEIIDISASSSEGFYEGGYILYRNTSRVECTKTEAGYNRFGEVIETKSLVLKNN